MKKLNIIYEDKDILVLNKPAGILTISDGKSASTIYQEASNYVKKAHKSNKVFIVHRLDKNTSGLLVLAKSPQIKKELQESWNLAVRKYIGIVENHLENKRGVIEAYLREDKNHHVYCTKKEKGIYAKTVYEVLNYTKQCTVLLLDIKTGRKNQIRASLEYIGHPLIGDKKYGSKKNPLGRLGLHACYLKIYKNNKEYEFTCNPPQEFLKYLKK